MATPASTDVDSMKDLLQRLGLGAADEATISLIRRVQTAQAQAAAEKEAARECVRRLVMSAAAAVVTRAVRAGQTTVLHSVSAMLPLDALGLCDIGKSHPYQRTDAEPAYQCGRPDGYAPLPAAVFVEAFHTFHSHLSRSRAHAAQLDEQALAYASTLNRLLCRGFPDENAGMHPALVRVLTAVFAGTAGAQVFSDRIAVSKTCSTDGGMLDETGQALFIVELKKGLSSSGDPILQLVQYYAKLSAERRLPALLLVVAGTHIVWFAGFWYNGRPQIGVLTACIVDTSLRGTLETARVLHAARACVTALHTQRADHVAQSKALLTYPWITSIGRYTLEYQVALCPPQEQSRLLFIARVTAVRDSDAMLKPGQTCWPGALVGDDVVVKFSDSYAPAVHKAAEKARFAASLYAHVVIADAWHVTVVQLLDVPRWHTLRALTQACKRQAGADADDDVLRDHCITYGSDVPVPLLSPVSMQELQTLLTSRYKAFRDADIDHGPFVHGDLHQANIMVCVHERDGAAFATDVRAIDFDWAGRSGEVFYHPFINMEGLFWPAGVKPCHPILADHDWRLVSRDLNTAVDLLTPEPSPIKLAACDHAAGAEAAASAAVTTAAPRRSTASASAVSMRARGNGASARGQFIETITEAAKDV